MTIEKIMQRLDRIEGALGITQNLAQNKTFLTLEEAKEKGYSWHEHGDGVYEYRQDDKWALIENGKVLIDNVDWTEWYQLGVYDYKKNGKKTLIENGVVLIDNVDFVHWYATGVYEYRQGDKWTLIENGKVLVDGVDWVHWYEGGFYGYKKDGKRFEVKNGITTEI